MKKKENANIKKNKKETVRKRAIEKIDCLLELHNLQRILLTVLRKEV